MSQAQPAHRIVRIDWVDSVVDGGWSGREEAIERATKADVMDASSVGFVLSDADGYFLLATSYMRDGDLVQGTLQIPRKAVRAVVTLDPGPEVEDTR